MLLNQRVKALNRQLSEEGIRPHPKAEVRLLGQLSLLVDMKVSLVLSLAQTADMDALLNMDHSIKMELSAILVKEGFVYDEDSPLVWIPKGAKFQSLFDFEFVLVTTLDPEATLISKAVKAPKKNKLLIREAIASEHFPSLVEKILSNGGKLEDFV